MSTCAATSGNCFPKTPDIGVGDGLFDGGLDLVDVGHQLGGRQIAPQQHFVADNHTFNGVGIFGSEFYGACHFQFVLGAVGAQPNALPEFQAMFLGKGCDIVAALDGGIGAHRGGDFGKLGYVRLGLGLGGESVRQR